MRKITFLIVALLMSSALIAQTYYSEDFTNNPNFTSLSATHAYWDNSEGNYYVNTYDNLDYQYWGYSPQFINVLATENSIIEFDMLCENADWGTYPGVRFYNEEPTDMNSIVSTLSISFIWSGTHNKKINCYDNSGIQRFVTSNSFANNVWYHIKITYDAQMNKADIVITETDTGNPFFELLNTDFELADFSWIGVGYYDTPNYGDDWSPIRIDNIEIYANIVISQQPQSDTVCEGGLATFSILSESDSLNYQWYHEGNPVSGTNDSILIIDPVNEVDEGNYYCQLWNQDTIISDTAILTVLTGCNHCIDTSIVTVYDTIVTEIFDTTIITIYDTIITEVFDTIVVYDTLITEIFDTTIVYDTLVTEVFDTIIVTIYDTLITEVFDTTIVTVYDTLTTEVFDTIYINETIPKPNSFSGNSY